MVLDCYINNKYAEENTFRQKRRENSELPVYSQIKNELPSPIWENHADTIDCYYKAWEIAFGNLRKPTNYSGFVSNFIDSAFNGCLFMWDSAFIMMFGKYAKRIFDFQKTMDNLYCKQHPDGFICREIDESNGKDRFERFNPVSTGPNILPWCEWEYYLINGDKKRLKKVFPVLLAYHNWLKHYRTWSDGTYWSSGWGCGMDNMPRLPKGYDVQFSHGHMVWADTCFQQILSAKTLIRMSKIIGRKSDVNALENEVEHLTKYVNEILWDDNCAYYYDLWNNGELNYVKSIGAYWALLADVVPKDRVDRFIAHLDNDNEFKRTHRVPTLSADSPYYEKFGRYWRGSVWAPTNYMVLKGLEKEGYLKLAHEIALNHVLNVTEVYKSHGTLYENYSPETVDKGESSKENFVGWTGLSAISIMFEYVFGIISDVNKDKIVWNVNLLDKHGVKNYPFGKDITLDLVCEARNSPDEEPVIHVQCNSDIVVEVLWGDNKKVIKYLKSEI